jgi:hypothetical protein
MLALSRFHAGMPILFIWFSFETNIVRHQPKGCRELYSSSQGQVNKGTFSPLLIVIQETMMDNANLFRISYWVLTTLLAIICDPISDCWPLLPFFRIWQIRAWGKCRMRRGAWYHDNKQVSEQQIYCAPHVLGQIYQGSQFISYFVCFCLFPLLISSEGQG